MSLTSWKPVLVGVDGSPASVAAARAAWHLAEAAGVKCHLLHVLPEAWELPIEPRIESGLDPAALNRVAAEYARQTIQTELAGSLPPEAIAQLEIRLGRPVAAITAAVQEYEAGLVIVGGKHHTALGRWLGGSTAHGLVRTLDLPILIARDLSLPLTSVVAAVDLSEAASPTVHVAERFAGLFEAALGLVHVVAPPPPAVGIPSSLFQVEAAERSREQLTRYVWPLTTYPGACTNVRYGAVEAEIAEEAAALNADLVVVGSHGKGWFDRVVIGSTTERLLDMLPTSLLVVPVVGARQRRPQRVLAPRLQLVT